MRFLFVVAFVSLVMTSPMTAQSTPFAKDGMIRAAYFDESRSCSEGLEDG